MLIQHIDDTLGGVLTAITCPKIGGKVEACRIAITERGRVCSVFLTVEDMRRLALAILDAIPERLAPPSR